jgi:hypothetical protein
VSHNLGRTRATLEQVARAVKQKEHYNVPLYYCVDVSVCSRNHLSRAHRPSPCVWQTIARTPNQGRNLPGETRGIGGPAQELRWPLGARPAESIAHYHMQSGACLEGEAVRTVEDSAVATHASQAVTGDYDFDRTAAHRDTPDPIHYRCQMRRLANDGVRHST